MASLFTKAQGSASAVILGIGTAVPANCMYQSEYPDFYFRVTRSEHLTDLKQKFKRICERSTIEKRHLHMTEDIINANKNLATYKASSLSTRQLILTKEVPKLGMEAALNAISDWGKSVGDVTHLIFSTASGVRMPGADFELTKLLGLKPSVQRFMMYHQGCYAGAASLRLAKDVAENNRDARVLVVCSEMTVSSFHAPSETHLDILIGSAIFGDGAAALIVGADDNIESTMERPLYQIVHTAQRLVPDTEEGIVAMTCEMGLSYFLSKNIPKIVADNAVQCLIDTFAPPRDAFDWNSLFYLVHPGGPTILDGIEEQLELRKDKLKASRKVLREYGNMWGPSVFFALQEMRNCSVKEKKEPLVKGLS